MNTFKETDCPKWLPECNTTFYDASITTIPFSKCDSANTVMSFLCKFKGIWEKPLPKRYSVYLNNATINSGHGISSLSDICTYNTKDIFSK